MKVRTDCSKCRKALLEEAERQYAEHYYEMFENTVDSAAAWAAAISLSVLIRQNKSPDEIKEFFKEFCFISSLSEVFGKEITVENVVKRLETEYDIDFNDIEVHVENKKQFMKRYYELEKE